MDWSRAKTILIVAFLLLNLLLGYQLWNDRGNLAGAGGEDPQIVRAFEQLLASKNIRLAVPLPQETPRMREITFKIAPADGRPSPEKVDPPLPVSVFNDQAAYQEALADALPSGDLYELSMIDSNDWQLVLFQIERNYPLFDVRLELTVDSGMVTAYRQMLATPVPSGLQDEQKVLSSLAAISILAEKFLQEGTTIVDVRLGYHGQMFNSEIRYMAPFWRVVTEQGDSYFVHAITGAVE